MACKVKVTKSGFLAFRLHYEGWHSWEGTKYRNTPENRKEAQNTARIISAEMKARRFDYIAWFPEGNRAEEYRPKIDKPASQTIRQYYAEWIATKIPPLVKKSRARKYKSHFNVIFYLFRGISSSVSTGYRKLERCWFI